MKASPEIHPRKETGPSPEQNEGLFLIKTLIEDLEKENREFGYGSRMGRMMAKMIMGESNDVGEKLENAQQDVQAETEASIQVGETELKMKHAKTLERFGLSLTGQRESGFSLNVIDVDKFIGGISTLAVPEVANNSVYVKELVGYIESQVKSSVAEAGGSQDSVGNSFLNRLKEISSVLRKIFQSTDFSRIDTYTKFNETGRLEEYIVVEKKRLWIEPGSGFGPGDWVIDITPEELEKSWKRALDELNMQDIKSERGVGTELREHLLKCIAHSSEKLKSLEWKEDIKAQMQAVLIKYSQLLRGRNTLN